MRINFFNFFNFYSKKDYYNSFNFISINSFINILFIISNSIMYLNKILIDIFVSDYIYFKKRFRICYNIMSSLFKEYNLFSYSLVLLQPFISIYIIFKSSIWLEREVFDMFGVKFINNWDLRRILTDYTFFGYPLRKDFPLSGYVELLFDIIKRTTFETFIEFMQEMRFFFNSSAVEYWDIEENL